MNFLKRFFRLKHSYLVLIKRTYIELQQPITITSSNIRLDDSDPANLIYQIEGLTPTKPIVTEIEEWVHESEADHRTVMTMRSEP